jgi:hypothetical protein
LASEGEECGRGDLQGRERDVCALHVGNIRVIAVGEGDGLAGWLHIIIVARTRGQTCD